MIFHPLSERHTPKLSLFYEISCKIAPLAVLVFLWLPIIVHFHVPSITVAGTAVERARQTPSDSTLEELSGFRFFGRGNEAAAPLLDRMEKLLKKPNERVEFPEESVEGQDGLRRVPFPLDKITRSSQLLEAYAASGRVEFLSAARDSILEWAAVERKAWLPTGLLWNDHVTAEGVLLLARFWRAYRNHPIYEPKVANTVMGLVVRSAQFLAKPGHFGFSSNHGIMQNLALWHYCLVFPTLPNVEHYKQLALERLRDQMKFYVNDEGVVLEHSAGYQKAGVQFVGLALRYLSLMDITPPPDWIAKYGRAQQFYSLLRRPDGSLPVYGDTKKSKDTLGLRVTSLDSEGRAAPLRYENRWRPRQSRSLFPGAGYVVWWDGLENWPDERRLTQTVVLWSNFPGHAHKHADELSLLLWARGSSWLTNVGYWPYGRGRSGPLSWDGSNAPHLVEEKMDSQRETRLRSYAWSKDRAAIDLERVIAGGHSIRRQVIHLNGKLWLVLDCIVSTEDTETIWNTSSEIMVKNGSRPGTYKLESEAAALTVTFLGSQGIQTSHLRGSREPFAGWNVVGSSFQPASAIVVKQPAGQTWSATIWSLDDVKSRLNLPDSPEMESWNNGENWRLKIPTENGLLRLERRGAFIETGTGALLKLSEPPNFTNSLNAVRNGFLAAEAKYPTKFIAIPLRTKLTWLVFAAYIAQETFLFLYWRTGGMYYAKMRMFSALLWVTAATLLAVCWHLVVESKNPI